MMASTQEQGSEPSTLFTVQSVLQGLASDSALLLSLVTTIERTATAEQKAAFTRHFVSLLLLCRDEGVFAGSELLSELFILDLDEAMWHQRDASVFLRRSSTIVSSLLDQLSRETFTSPEGNLLPHLVAATRVLSAGDDASSSSIATPMGVSPGQWSRHSGEGPLASTTNPDGTSVYDRFTTSELAGLSTAEQQFFGDLGRSPYLVHSFASSAGSTGMEGTRPPMSGSFGGSHPHNGPQQQQQHQQLRQHPQRGVSPYGMNGNGGAAASSTGWRGDSFRYTRDTDAFGNSGSRPATRTAFTGSQIREAVDFFSEAAAATADPKSVHNAELTLNVVDVRAEAVLTLALQIEEVVARHISDCPLVLRRAFWLWLRASSGRSGPPDSAEISPELGVTTASADANTPPMNLRSAASKSPAPPTVSFEFVGMATMVVLHMLTPLLMSIPCFVLPVEEEEGSAAYVTTTSRFSFMAKLLQRAAYGVPFDERHEAGLAPLNRGMRELHRRWISCFSALADYRTASSMNWCCPLPTPSRGLAVSEALQAEEQAVLRRYFAFLDGFVVPYLQTTVLLRRFTEAIHLPQWLRCTYYAARFARGQTGIASGDGAPPPAPPLLFVDVAGAAEDVFAALSATGSEEAKLQRMSEAIAHVVHGLCTKKCSTATVRVSAFMANFLFFLGTNSDSKVTTLVIYEDLLRRYWAQPAPQDGASEALADINKTEATAVLIFYIYLAVQHNVVSPQFQLVLIPSVLDALCADQQRQRQQPLQHHRDPTVPSTPVFSTSDTLQWIGQVLESVPTSYRRHCVLLWTAAIASDTTRLTSPRQEALLPSSAPSMPQLRTCGSFSELMARLSRGLSTYIPLSADDYHWMVYEQQQQQLAVTMNDNNASAEKTGKSATWAAAATGTTAPPKRCTTVSAAITSPATLHSLRARWRRPLAVSESLSASGILPLHSTRGLFEVLCTVTCRRLWTDGTLQPLMGMSALGALAQPLCAITQLYGTAADVAATLLVAVDATPPPRWLRDLHFSHGSVSVHVGSTGSRKAPASPTAASASGGGVGRMRQCIDEVHWPQCAWFYPPVGDADEANGSAASSAAATSLCTQWEALMQHVLFFSSEFDANLPDYADDSNVAEQILSTRWGLSEDGGVPSSPLPESKSTAGAAALTALHAVPSLRHLSIESLWRLFLFNVRQTCHIMRRMTPRECPFYRMEGAITEVLRGGTAVRKSPTMAQRPGFEETSTTFTECVSQAAADALRSCFPSEVTIVRLIVSVAAYIRNVYTAVEQLRDNGASVPAAMTPAAYREVARSGTAQLLYGKAPLTAAQERLVELLCFDGEALIQKAYLPYYENCTWHPYGRLLYDC